MEEKDNIPLKMHTERRLLFCFHSETPKGQSLKSMGILKLCRETLKGLLHYLLQQGFVAVDHVVYHIPIGDGFKVFSCAVNLRRLNQTQLH